MKLPYLFSLPALLISWMTNAPAIDAVPEPGLIIYGRVYSLSAPTQTVAIGSITWNNTPGGEGTPVTISNYSVPEVIPSDPNRSYYIARIPFETVNPGGLTLTNTPHFDLLTTPDPHQLGFRITPFGTGTALNAQAKAINGVAQSNQTYYNWSDITANAGAQKRGSLVRLDLLVDAPPRDLFPEWIAGYLPGGGPNASRTADPDGDGQTNEQEFLAGTHPLDRSSVLLAWFVPSANPATFNIVWRSVPQKRYQVDRTDNLLGAGTVWIEDGSVFQATEDSSQRPVNLQAGSRWFYRVRVVP